VRELFHRAHLIQNLVTGGAAQFLSKRFDNRQGGNAGAQRDGHELRPALQKGRRHLCKRIVQLRPHKSLIVAGEAPITHVRDNADHDERSKLGLGGVVRIEGLRRRQPRLA